MLFIDGWSWKTGHKNVPYDEIRALVKNLQPECLLVDNTHLRCLYHNDLIHFEEGSSCPADNRLPAMLSKLIYLDSGNSWFWDDRIPAANLLNVNEIVNHQLNYLEPRWCTFILNCPPNPAGKLDDNIVQRLAEVGKVWSPDLDRPALPVQSPQMDRPVTPKSAIATSGGAFFAIDGFNDRFYYSVWESTNKLPQSITIDLGREYDDISILSYVPKYKSVITPLTQGSIKSYKIYKSLDNVNFYQIADGVWNGDINMKVVTFTPTRARYIRLEALTAVGNFAAATEIAIGRENYHTGINNFHGTSELNFFETEQHYQNSFNLPTVKWYGNY
jgi:alpha-L-fucosidase